jgi:hypothetical protein
VPIAPWVRTRLEKGAADNGFDLERPGEGEWLAFASSHAPLRVWLTAYGDGWFIAALSQRNVWREVAGQGASFPSPLPAGACGAYGVTELPALDRLLRRAFLLSRTLPDELFRVFAERTADLPRSTEAERLVVQRVGQDVFREGLLDYWDRRCAITGFCVERLLRASHIKPWAACARDEERLDVFNGFLLSPGMDAAFDAGFITIADDGAVVVAEALDAPARATLGLDRAAKVGRLADGHRRYLEWHRGRVFGS